MYFPFLIGNSIGGIFGKIVRVLFGSFGATFEENLIKVLIADIEAFESLSFFFNHINLK